MTSASRPSTATELRQGFWVESSYLNRPMAQRVGAGLGKARGGPTVEPLGIGSPANAANYMLDSTNHYEHLSSTQRLALAESADRSWHGRIAGFAHIGASGEPKEPIAGTFPENRGSLPPRLRHWQPQEKRLQRAAQSAHRHLTKLLSEPALLTLSTRGPDTSPAMRGRPPTVRGKDPSLDAKSPARPNFEDGLNYRHATGTFAAMPGTRGLARDGDDLARDDNLAQDDGARAGKKATHADAGAPGAAEEAAAMAALAFPNKQVSQSRVPSRVPPRGAGGMRNTHPVASAAGAEAHEHAGHDQRRSHASKTTHPHPTAVQPVAHRSLQKKIPKRQAAPMRIHRNMTVPTSGYEPRDANGK